VANSALSPPRLGDPIRAAAKWLVASLAAIGGVVIAGTQFSSVGELEPWSDRWWTAIAAVAVALLAVFGAILATLPILLPGAPPSFDDLLKRAETPPRGWFGRSPEDRFFGKHPQMLEVPQQGAFDLLGSLRAIRGEYNHATDRLEKANAAYAQLPGNATPTAIAKALATCDEAFAALAEQEMIQGLILEKAGYSRLLYGFKWRTAPTVALATLLAAAAVFAFAFATHPRQQEASTATVFTWFNHTWRREDLRAFESAAYGHGLHRIDVTKLYHDHPRVRQLFGITL
jgi:hypothetical protein